MKSPYVFAIASCNHLAEMRVLMASVARHWPEAKRVVFLVDSPEGRFNPSKENFEVIAAEKAGLPCYRHMAFAYTAAELCFALKSFCARYLLEKRQADAAVYLDGDMLLLNKPVDLIAALQAHPIVITPQRLLVSNDECMHFYNVMHGPFNGGFFAVAKDPEADAFLRWWGRQVTEPNNVSIHWQFDQGWLSFAPVLFPRTVILRHPGYNAAFWNMVEREVRRDAAWEGEKVERWEDGVSSKASVVSGRKTEDGKWRVRFGGDEYPLVLYHFSLFDMNRPDSFTGALDSGCGVPNDSMKILLQDYADRLAAAGHAECHAWPYGFGAFADGEPVTPGHREYFKQRFFRRIGPDSDPFDPQTKLPGGDGLRSLRKFNHPVSRLVRRIKSMARGILDAS